MADFTTAISSDRPPMVQSTWSNSPETLLKNNAVNELKFHYENGDQDKKNSIEKAAMSHIMNICGNLNYVADDEVQNKSVNTATRLVEYFSGKNDIHNKAELAKEIQNTHQFDFSVLNKETASSSLQTLKNFINNILPDAAIQADVAVQTDVATQTDVAIQTDVTKAQSATEHLVKTSNHSNMEAIVITATDNKDLISETPNPQLEMGELDKPIVLNLEENKENDNFISRFFTKISAILTTIISPHR
ncbi:Uncharacterised protein [Yersinia rohdei]|uniref:hypothetical protein n=1 Tax=Yersinia rohdei TaxID=29485 RepID=UPI00061C0D2C|nr:hypothetical protein [Yersinia rohdei]MDN0094767.1 hypothetical protein [Yersinia rohdei]CNF25250.1 Uncharacterised protein [Yersinia rohdei]